MKKIIKRILSKLKMRSKKEIFADLNRRLDGYYFRESPHANEKIPKTDELCLEVLLDIRELLIK